MMMPYAKPFWSVWSLVSVTFVALTAFNAPAFGQGAPSVRVGGVEVTGVPDDWTHHHVVFSNPGTEQEAIQSGHYAQWQKVVNDPRYVIQQLKKNLPVQGPAAVDAEYRSRWASEAAGIRTPPGFGPRSPRPFAPFRKPINQQSDLKKDWSQPLGGPGLAANQFPAKYSISTTTASCSDYIVYPTGAVGGSGQATIMAFTNIYVGGGCGSTNPTVYWSFYTPPTGGTDHAAATLSPVLSLDGKQVAFVEEDTTASGTPAYLVILRMAAGGTSDTSPAYPGHGLTYYASDLYLTSCTASAAPCYTTLKLLHGATAATDSNSAPYYVYTTADKLYVGDDSGYVHEVIGAFNGTPTLDPTGWPVAASTKGSPALNSPVYDSVSGDIFVGDASGFLYQFVPGAAPITAGISGQLEYDTAGMDSVVIDDTSGTNYVYQFVGYSDDTGHDRPSYINRFTITTPATLSGGFGTGVHYPNESTAGRPAGTSTIMRSGAFDDTFYADGGTAGNIYSCADGVMYQVPISTIGTSVVNTFDTPTSATAACSPVTEFLSLKASTTLGAAFADPEPTTTIGTGGTTNPTVHTTTLTAAITAGATSFAVTSAANIPIDSYIEIGTEIMYVSAKSGNTLTTVIRGEFGTVPAAALNGATVTSLNSNSFLVTSAANLAVALGDFVQDGTEIMYVTGLSGDTLTAIRGVLTTQATHGAGTTITNITANVASTTGIQVGDYVQIGSEILLVDGAGLGGTTLGVTVASLGTTEAAHSDSATVQDIQDWLYASAVNDGNVGACTGAGCLFNYSVLGAGTTGTPTAGFAAGGGTSGIVVDNQVLPATQVGAEQIYYSTLTGDTAVQASQSNP